MFMFTEHVTYKCEEMCIIHEVSEVVKCLTYRVIPLSHVLQCYKEKQHSSNSFGDLGVCVCVCVCVRVCSSSELAC